MLLAPTCAHAIWGFFYLLFLGGMCKIWNSKTGGLRTATPFWHLQLFSPIFKDCSHHPSVNFILNFVLNHCLFRGSSEVKLLLLSMFCQKKRRSVGTMLLLNLFFLESPQKSPTIFQKTITFQLRKTNGWRSVTWTEGPGVIHECWWPKMAASVTAQIRSECRQLSSLS